MTSSLEPFLATPLQSNRLVSSGNEDVAVLGEMQHIHVGMPAGRLFEDCTSKTVNVAGYLGSSLGICSSNYMSIRGSFDVKVCRM